jgi:hypothetical protein
MIRCAEQTAKTNQQCRPKKSHLIFCGPWFEDGVQLRPSIQPVPAAGHPEAGCTIASTILTPLQMEQIIQAQIYITVAQRRYPVAAAISAPIHK